jgi:hypothetical protein
LLIQCARPLVFKQMTNFNIEHRKRFTNYNRNKKDLITLLEKSDLDDKKLDILYEILQQSVPSGMIEKIHNYLDKDYKTIDKIANFLKEECVNEYEWILENLFTLNQRDIHTLCEAYKIAMMPSDKVVEFSFDTDLDLTTRAVENIYDCKFDGVGKGELLLAWIHNGAKLSVKSERGDISYRGNNYEVKAESGRLCGQSGFGQGSEVAKSWYEDTKWLLKKLNFYVKVPTAPPLEKAREPKKWNLGGEDYSRVYYFQLKEYFSEDWTNIRSEYIEIIKKGWKKLFTNWKNAELDLSFVDDFYSETIDSKTYHLNLLFTNIKYYLYQQSSIGIFFCNKSGYLYLPKTFFDSPTKEKLALLNEKLKYSLPGFSHAVAQGKVFSVKYMEPR